MKLKLTLTSGDFKAKIYWRSEWRTFQVKFFANNKHLKRGDYFTDDETDAKETAKKALERLAK